MQHLRGFGLAPVGCFQRFDNFTPLEIRHHFKQRSVGGKRPLSSRRIRTPPACRIWSGSTSTGHGLVRGQHHGALDGILELPNVAGPGVFNQQLHCLGGKLELRLPVRIEEIVVLLAVLLEEMLDQ